MKDPINTAMQRAQRYWYRDELVEIGLSFIFAILGGYFYLEVILPEDSLLRTLLESSFVLLIIGSIFLGNWLIPWLKQRITYPRTGYISYRKQKGVSRWLLCIFAAVVAIVTAYIFIRAPVSFAYMPAATGVILGFVLLFLSFRNGPFRFAVLGLLSFLAGLGLSIAGIGNYIGLAYLYFIASILLLLSGGLTLIHYLRTTEPPAVEPN